MCNPLQEYKRLKVKRAKKDDREKGVISTLQRKRTRRLGLGLSSQM